MNDIFKKYEKFHLTDELISRLGEFSKSNSLITFQYNSGFIVETLLVKDGVAQVIAKEEIYG